MKSQSVRIFGLFGTHALITLLRPDEWSGLLTFTLFAASAIFLRTDMVAFFLVTLVFNVSLVELAPLNSEFRSSHLVLAILGITTLWKNRELFGRNWVAPVVFSFWAIALAIYSVILFLSLESQDSGNFQGFSKTLLTGFVFAIVGYFWWSCASRREVRSLLLTVILICIGSIAIYIGALLYNHWFLLDDGVGSFLLTRRLEFPFGSPTYSGHYLQVGLVAALLYSLERKRLGTVAATVIVYGLFLTGSRSAVIAITVLGVVVLVWFVTNRSTTSLSLLSSGLIAGLSGLFFAGLHFTLALYLPPARVGLARTISSPTIPDSSRSQEVREFVSARLFTDEYRIQSYLDALSLDRTAVDFLFGQGFVGYAAHSAFLSLFINYGLVGFALLLVPVAAIYFSLMSSRNTVNALLVAGSLSLMSRFIFTDGFSMESIFFIAGSVLAHSLFNSGRLSKEILLR